MVCGEVRLIEQLIALHRIDNRIETAKDITDREGAWDDENPSTDTAPRWIFLILIITHELTLPIIEIPPLTCSPRLTVTVTFSGKNRSTREPNLIKPTLSPSCTRSSIFFQKTIRRAINPAICLNTILACWFSTVMTFISFSTDAFSLAATRNFPGR